MSAWTLLKSGFALQFYFMRNNRAALVSSLVWPYLTLGLLLGMGAFFGSPEHLSQKVGARVNYVTYFVASTVAAMTSLDLLWGVGGSVLHHRWAGTLPYILLSPEGTSATLVLSYVPRYLLSAGIQLAEFAPLILLVEGGAPGASKVAVMALAVTLGMLPALGFAALFASLMLMVKEESNILGWLNPLILLFSGAFYPAYLLPVWARAISYALPTTYTIELARLASVIGSPEMRGVALLAGVLAAMSVVYNAASSVAVEAGERRAMREGAV